MKPGVNAHRIQKPLRLTVTVHLTMSKAAPMPDSIWCNTNPDLLGPQHQQLQPCMHACIWHNLLAIGQLHPCPSCCTQDAVEPTPTTAHWHRHSPPHTSSHIHTPACKKHHTLTNYDAAQCRWCCAGAGPEGPMWCVLLATLLRPALSVRPATTPAPATWAAAATPPPS